MPVLQNVPIDVLQAALRQSTGDESATLTDVEVVPMQHVGWGGNDLFRTEVTWTGREGTTSTDWVVKHWCPGVGRAYRWASLCRSKRWPGSAAFWGRSGCLMASGSLRERVR